MRKLMIATATLCAAVSVNALESANVVGYVATPVAANTWQINGCQFQAVGDDEVDLQDLICGFVTKNVGYGDGNTFKATAPCIQVQNRDANGNLTAGTKLFFYLVDAAVDEDGNVVTEGWADEMGYYVGDKVTVGNTEYTCYSPAVKIAPGTAVWFKDPQAAAPGATSSGEVIGEATASAIKANGGNWSLTANPYPIAFDLNSNNITWTGLDKSNSYGDGNAFKKTAPTIQIQNRDAQGNLTAGTKLFFYLTDAAVDEDGNVVTEGWADEMGYYVGGTVNVGGTSYTCYAPAATVGAGLGFWFKDYKSTVTITFQK